MTFFFYDLETSGFNPKTARIMQFGGQRTNEDLRPIGEPVNLYIKLSEDVLPDPQAILVTGLTPDEVNSKGITEAEFLRIFHENIATFGTVFVGFNSVRFDDEFMRYLHYRNYYDPYEWHWQAGRSRWDLLDVTRMMRALRPDGIKWPIDSSGKPSNRLELLAAANKLEHLRAHDALSDVNASIALAKLIKSKQPKLFDYLFSIRGKNEVQKIVSTKKPFVYSSGKYENQFQKTTIAIKVTDHPDGGGALVYDLRYDPTQFVAMSPAQLANIWQWSPDPERDRLPVKTLKYNRCPAIAPLSVLDKPSLERLSLDTDKIQKHNHILINSHNFTDNLKKAIAILDKKRQTSLISESTFVDEQLYDGFFKNTDKSAMKQVRDDTTLTKAPKFSDVRLNKLWLPYKARNFKQLLTPKELAEWNNYRNNKLEKYAGSYFAALESLLVNHLSSDKKKLLHQLKFYVEKIITNSTVF